MLTLLAGQPSADHDKRDRQTQERDESKSMDVLMR